MLTEDDQTFLRQRRRLVSLGNLAVVSVLILLGATYTWLCFTSPFLANPFYVARAIQQKTMETSVLTTAALILPVVVIGLFVTVGIFTLLGYVILANEKKYLKLIDKLQELHSHGNSTR